MHQSSVLLEDIDTAFRLLQDDRSFSQSIAFFHSADIILSKVTQEIGTNTPYFEEWAAIATSIKAMRKALRTFCENLERTKRTKLPEPFPPVIPELIRNIRSVVTTSRACRDALALNQVSCDWSLQHRITRHRLELGALLSNLEQSVNPKLIYDISLGELTHSRSLLDISATATPRRYRLVECSPLTQSGTLRIWEFTNFPSVAFSAISYVWKGNNVESGVSDTPEFSVRGAEDADPIGTDVLHDSCAASLSQGIPYIWVDRLCIMQTSRDDKNWQISRMYNMYRFSSSCIIIPGGLRWLVTLQRETQWIHRGWTLQEALAPPIVQVLFSWTFGNFRAIPATDDSAFFGEITEVVEGRSAMAPLWLVLDGCIAGRVWIYDPGILNPRNRSESICVFGTAPEARSGSNFQFALPHVAALALAVSRSMQEDYDRKCYTIWKCALMRTSSRPVDMVFSIMGLFGISLDVSQFDKNDRLGATIALTREILRRGGRANWLALSFHAPPSPHLSIFPNFPRTAVAGKAIIRVKDSHYIEMSKLMDNEYPNSEVLGAMPQGSMDMNGYFTFEAKSVSIFQAPTTREELGGLSPKANTSHLGPRWFGSPDTKRLKATNGVEWEVCDGEISPREPHSSDKQVRAFAVLLGCFFGYTPTMTLAYDCNNVRGMIIEEHQPGKYHVNSYFMLSIKTIDWVISWSQRSFCVGGPEKPGQDAGHDEPIEEVNEIERHIPLPDTNATFANIQSKHIVAIALAAQEARRR